MFTRRFRIASSLARLIRRERQPEGPFVEAYFPPLPDRTHFVSIEARGCQLVLATPGPEGVAVEERTEVPRAHAEALLDLCAGKIAYGRAYLDLPQLRQVLLDQYITPKRCDLLTIRFEAREEANAFVPPLWFGPEVTSDPAFENRAIALRGLPDSGEVTLSNAALEALLDALEGQHAPRRPIGAPAEARYEGELLAGTASAVPLEASAPGALLPAPEPDVTATDAQESAPVMGPAEASRGPAEAHSDPGEDSEVLTNLSRWVQNARIRAGARDGAKTLTAELANSG